MADTVGSGPSRTWFEQSGEVVRHACGAVALIWAMRSRADGATARTGWKC